MQRAPRDEDCVFLSTAKAWPLVLWQKFVQKLRHTLTKEALLIGFSKGSKEVVCKRAVALIDAGAMVVTPKVPINGELEALATWAEAN